MKPRIIKISLPNGPLKGATIVFLKPEIRKNKVYTDTVTEERDNPIHMDMENLIKDLRPHLLSIYNILHHRQSEGEQKSLILETDIKEVEFTRDSFMIKGEMMVFGEKRITLKTPKMQESDEYDGFKDVLAIIDSLVVEAEGYLSGMKVVDDREMAIRYIEAKKDAAMTKEMFEALNESEQKEYIKKNIKTTGIDVEELDEKEEENGPDDDEIVLDEAVEVIAPKEKKPKKEKKDKVLVVGNIPEDDSVNVPETPAF